MRRVTVSLDEETVKLIDSFAKKEGNISRSDAIRILLMKLRRKNEL